MMNCVQPIAEKARAWAEKRARRDGFAFDLRGMCAISSAYLFNELLKADIDAIIAANFGHCFVKVGEHIVDVTATQFGIQDHVYIVLPRDLPKATQHYWHSSVEFKSVADLKRWQLNIGWPEEQLAKLL